MNLQEENDKLKSQLAHAKEWMQREVLSWDYNHKEVTQEQIYRFFPSEALAHFPSNALESILSAELIYKHLLEWEDIDGIWVILGYGKVLDEMWELYITKGFRKYFQKHSQNISYQNTPLEKSLRLVVEKKHILSLGRLYQILKKWEELWPLALLFLDYLKSRKFLQKALRESDFSLQLEQLIHLQVLTDKRHSWIVNKEDTITARNLIIWDFSDTNCMLYTLANSQNTDI